MRTGRQEGMGGGAPREGAGSSNAARKTHPKSQRPLCLPQEGRGTWLGLGWGLAVTSRRAKPEEVG